MSRICVLGSFNIDIMSAVSRFPRTGETITVDTFDLQIGGGKGANQAVALGRLGADVMMVGKLGERFYGPEYLTVLEKNGVSCEAVDVVPNAFPGAAFVAVDGNRDNILFIYPGTNALVDADWIDRNWHSISGCSVFLMQLEIPMETNLHLMHRTSTRERVLILDPAPAKPLPGALLTGVDFLTPNEVELGMLTDRRVETESDFKEACDVLLAKGAKTIIAKAGKRGAYVADGSNFSLVPGFQVNAVDPTAAGDSFNAGFALALTEGRAVLECVRFANAVAALSTTAFGAQQAMPVRAEVDAFLRRHE